MAVPVLTVHDRGCKWGRFDGQVDQHGRILSGEVAPGHTDAARRFADAYNLHLAAGATSGWIAAAYADGQVKAEVYDSRAAAVADCWPYEDRYFYAVLGRGQMSVCAAESLLRYKRVMSEMERPDRDARAGGLEVIPRLCKEDMEAQIRAVRTGVGAIALGYRNRK